MHLAVFRWKICCHASLHSLVRCCFTLFTFAQCIVSDYFHYFHRRTFTVFSCIFSTIKAFLSFLGEKRGEKSIFLDFAAIKMFFFISLVVFFVGCTLVAQWRPREMFFLVLQHVNFVSEKPWLNMKIGVKSLFYYIHFYRTSLPYVSGLCVVTIIRLCW